MTRSVALDDPRYATAITEPEIEKYYGRVMGVPKKRGDWFSPADFLPAGTQAGIAAAARPGFTLLAIADREIEGLDTFGRDDRVAVLLRGVLETLPDQVESLIGESPAISKVVAQSVRIARASKAGQTVLEIHNEDLTELQVALVRSITARDQLDDRSHLVAVALPRENGKSNDEDRGTAGIESVNPLTGIKSTEFIVGRNRSVHYFTPKASQ